MRKILTICIAAAVIILAGFITAPAPCEDQPGGYVEFSQGVYHTVKKGDTLWDLSDRFYDQPSLWPDLWSNNPDITNPHWIYPGQIVTLYLRRSKEWVGEGDMGAQDASGAFRRKTVRIPSLDQIGFIRKYAMPSSGLIVKGNNLGVMLSEGVIVYIKPKASVKYAVGDRFTIWRNEGIVANPYKGENQPLGVHHRIMGLVSVTNVGREIVTAKVEESYDGIRAGDLLMPMRDISNKPMPVFPGKPGITGHIVAAEDQLNIIGDGHVVFLDIGKKEGVEVGQVYTAYYKQDPIELDDESFVDLPDIDAAKVLVLNVEDEASTAVVLDSPEILCPGALVRAYTAPLY
ncbi:MAG: LysM peptidoglycan-binding domain-containing protein [Deltaproteobacteria bacterium]|nr:LysM peptidoglycan-binding domain-containing protein [Deltaproteobacteria bacterium]